MLVSELPRSVLRFRQCQGCTYDLATGEGVRGCAYYDCPYLPKELRVICQWCGFNFFTADGHVRCDHDTCEHAIEMKKNLVTYKAWQEHLADSA